MKRAYLAIVVALALLAGCDSSQSQPAKPASNVAAYGSPSYQYSTAYDGKGSTKKPPESGNGDVPVPGYYRHDGKYVNPHYRTQPDGIPDNNYREKGNPYTGKPGSRSHR